MSVGKHLLYRPIPLRIRSLQPPQNHLRPGAEARPDAELGGGVLLRDPFDLGDFPAIHSGGFGR